MTVKMLVRKRPPYINDYPSQNENTILDCVLEVLELKDCDENGPCMFCLPATTYATHPEIRSVLGSWDSIRAIVTVKVLADVDGEERIIELEECLACENCAEKLKKMQKLSKEV